MDVITDKNKIEQVFGRYVDKVYPSKSEAIKIFTSGNQLVFYFGIDPTGPDIHLGHITNFLEIKRIIDLGHRVILLVGDFTAKIGDPTDKESARKVLSKDEIEENMKTYLAQIYKILKKNSFEVRYNSEWYDKMTFSDALELSSKATVQQMMARSMFKKRVKENKYIHINELLYPLIQGYDSVAMKVDGEIGGTDQTFNMLIGRDLLKSEINKDKIIITTKLLENPITGKKLMSKSEGQYISLNDSPDDIFGKVMALPDESIVSVFNYVTEVSDKRIEEIKERINSGENPRTIKEELANELVTMLFNNEEANRAGEEFKKIFSQNQIPDKINEFEIKENDSILTVIVNSGLVDSKSEGKRLINQKAVSINGEAIDDWRAKVKRGDIIKVGPRKFIKIK